MTTETAYPLFAAIDNQTRRLLTSEEEQQLARRAHAGDAKARGQLVERNLRLVVKVASGFKRRAPQFELHDLVSEGVLGLMRAIEKFDPDSGFKLSTYATWWITQAISRAADRDGTVSMPIDVRREIRMAERRLTDRDENATTDEVYEELSEGLRDRIDRDDVAAAQSAMRCGSLDYQATSADGSTDPIVNFIADPHCPDPAEAVVDGLDLKQQVTEITSALSWREQRFVERRFGLDGGEPATLLSLSRELSIDHPQARRMEREVMRKMRGEDERTATPCRPAAAILDLLNNGSERRPFPTRDGALALATNLADRFA